ncbi:MAG: hypothetical protein ACJAYU_001931 [Bradymonadia bacterium]
MFVVSACGDDPDPSSPSTDREWQTVVDSPGSALLAVHGTADDDVYVVGADDGSGPLALHFDGTGWSRLDTGVDGDLWWVQAVDDVVYMTGSDAHILRYADGEFERMSTPGLGKHIVFGLWAASANDVYAVGAVSGRNGFLWHYDGTAWVALDLPAGLPQDANQDVPALLKVAGSSSDDVWVVGDQGVAMRGNARSGFSLVDSGTSARLFTVYSNSNRTVAVGGAGSGVAISLSPDVSDFSPAQTPLLQGVHIDSDNTLWAVGARAHVCADTGSGCDRIATEIDLSIQSLHAVWTSPSGDVWTVGGNVLDTSLNAGVALVGSAASSPLPLIEIPSFTETLATTCPDDLVDSVASGSIARRWNEQLLQAVRRDLPRPTVHARNLFHVSAAFWDIWAAYDEESQGYLVDESRDGTVSEMETALSFAAYRLLTHRYAPAIGGDVSTDCFDKFMGVLELDTEFISTEGETPAAFGNRVALTYIETFQDDGANEANDYADPEGFSSGEPRLTVDSPGSNTDDPTVWQEIVLAEAVSQNGIPEGSGVRGYIGAQWGAVSPFAIQRPDDGGPYYTPDNVPREEPDLIAAVVEMLEYGRELDVSDGVTIDVSPGAYGNNPLGTNDGTGHSINPFTDEAYAPNLVQRGDFSRLMAEFWADGPTSETPPGHWNTLANDASDHPDMEHRLFGEGEPLDRLSWDVHMYLALNGALHDAAIAAWELKREHLTARPITLIRTFGARGQSTDPGGPSYAPDGLPLVPGLIEVITADSAAEGERHAHLSRYVGEVTVYSWRGEPGDRDREIGGVDWIRAIEWIPYQRRTFVTPAFPGYISGHSTFSRAGAEVLTQLTGSEYYPGGIGSYRIDPGWLFFEFGPSEALEIQWATYYDGADQAGQSRLWGGIHIWQDDIDGRIVGSDIGDRAVNAASQLYSR